MLPSQLLTFFFFFTFSTSLALGHQPVSLAPARRHRFNAGTGGQPIKRNGKKYRGVNLGGWLVLESWMTPSVFAQFDDTRVVDEWTLGQHIPHEKAVPILQAHWDSWVLEQDFQEMSEAGLNLVRIPVGYWMWDYDSAHEPYVISNQTEYLNRAILWAKKYGIEVLIDLHGVPGSQNGFDTSGRIGSVEFHHSFQNSVRATRVIRTIAETYSKEPFGGTVTMVELINEPLCERDEHLLNFTLQYYHDAYHAVRQAAGNEMAVVLADGFIPLTKWTELLKDTKWTNVYIDTHIYLNYFNANLGHKPIPFSQTDATDQLCQYRSALSKSPYPVIVGEWSMSLPSCPNCWEAPIEGFYFRQNTFQTQASLFESGDVAGWAMWAYRVEGQAPHSYESGVKAGWIPKPVTGSYPKTQC